jgi:branched-subunit amino acid ABC-type transport system permease component
VYAAARIGRSLLAAVQDLLYAVGFGLVTASILALSTVAISLQFSVTSIPNFAQGDLMTLGAYAAFTTSLMVQNALLSAVAAIVVSGVVSWGMYRFLLQPFIKRGTRNVTLLVVTLGVAIILQNGIQAIFGSTFVKYPFPVSPPENIGPFIWTGTDILIVMAAVVSLTFVHVVLRYTKFGKSQRAVADNAELARVSGINSGRVIEITWLWAGAMAGLSGFVLAASLGGLTPALGFGFLLVIFAAAVVGGIGNPYGSMLGALLIGLGMEISAIYIPADYKQTFAFVALIVTLLFRPNGLIASRSRVIQAA